MARTTTRILGLLAAQLVALAVASPAQAEFGFQPSSLLGNPSSQQAGAHGEFTAGFSLNGTPGEFGGFNPDGSLKEVDVDLPPGFVADPTVAQVCDDDRVLNDTNPCPREAAVGAVRYRVESPPFYFFSFDGYVPLFRVPTAPGAVASFVFRAVIVPVRLDAVVDAQGNYRIRSAGRQLAEAQPPSNVEVTLWGVPADHQGEDPNSDGSCGGRQFIADQSGCRSFGGPLAGAERRPFARNPTACDTPLVTAFAGVSWQGGQRASASVSSPALSGCDQLTFQPTLDISTSNRAAGQPAGYTIRLGVPQPDDPEQPGTPDLRNAVVTLPEGTAISPSAADGLGACSDAQLGRGSNAAESCPESSRIGQVTIDTPLLDEPLTGSAYLGTQLSSDPESGQMYRLFLTAATSGARIKLVGAVRADRSTGRLTATFTDNPQLPFTTLTVVLKDGPRAPLVNPTTCGVKQAGSTLTSWAGQTASPGASVTIDQSCPTGQFGPSFNAGTLSPAAGRFSPFTFTVGREDRDREFSQLGLSLPPGLIGLLRGVPVCGEAQAAAGTCGPQSRVGSTTVRAGSGSNPFALPGTVFLAGPYKGAPYSLSVVVPAKAGPLDLGTVVVRTPLRIDASKPTVSAPADPLPTIVGGVPLKLRQINVTLDRSNFTVNATSCSVNAVRGSVSAVGGGAVAVGARYQPLGCNALAYSPRLDLALRGSSTLKEGGHPPLTARLRQPRSQAATRSVRVTLPRSIALDPNNARALCKPEQAAALKCPKASIIGRATASTPALNRDLAGWVYFVEGRRTGRGGRVIKTLPKLLLALKGPDRIRLNLTGDTSVDSQDRLVTTFASVPDAPIDRFGLDIRGGRNGILVSTRPVCTTAKTAPVAFRAHSGKQREVNRGIRAAGCRDLARAQRGR